ncbi:MAG: hypothetical protein F6K19_26875 [Cyanothece sp. SIO1E1]|nr:hypothetical protein [Cyanothece sp. SIO1E1]
MIRGEQLMRQRYGMNNGWRTLGLLGFPLALLLSLGLHGLMLLLPVASKEEEVEIPPDLVVDTISITRIAPAREAEDEAEAKAAQKAKDVSKSPQATSTAPPRPLIRPAQPAQIGATKAKSTQPNPPNPAANSNPQVARPTSNSLPSGRLPRLNSQPQAQAPLQAPTPASTQPISATEPVGIASTLPPNNSVAAALDPDYIHTAKGTSPEEEAEKIASWISKLPDLGLVDPTPQVISEVLLVPYEGPSCLSTAPEAASVAVVVSADGKILDQPQLVRSTGYALLNQAVVETVKGHSFEQPETGEDTPYLLEAEVDYDSDTCP